MTRTGKIARLPSGIRHQLNSRIENGEQGKDLVEWLNSLDHVQQVLAKDFAGRPITEQNLSEWKQRGYLDWQQDREASAHLRDLVEFSDNLTAASPDRGIADRLSALLSIEFAAETRNILQQIADPRERWEYLRQAIPKLNILREGDHKSARERREMDRWQVERDDRAWVEKKAALKEAYDQITAPYELKRRRDTLVAVCGNTDYDIRNIEAMLAAELRYKAYRYIDLSGKPLRTPAKSAPNHPRVTQTEPAPKTHLDPTKSK